jgi:hypothetical protein
LSACLLFRVSGRRRHAGCKAWRCPGVGVVPVQAIQALPYLLSRSSCSPGFIGRAVAPKASGKPYVEERLGSTKTRAAVKFFHVELRFSYENHQQRAGHDSARRCGRRRVCIRTVKVELEVRKRRSASCAPSPGDQRPRRFRPASQQRANVAFVRHGD